MKPSEYELSDFLQDTSFRKWIDKSNQEDVLYWDIFLANHPEKAPLVEEAATLVKGIHFNKAAVPPEVLEQEWRSLSARLQQNQQVGKDTSWFAFRHYRAMVAVFLALVAVGLPLYYLAGVLSIQTHHTSFGERASITLPDHSVVELHGNTTLRYARSWQPGEDRQVWLEGEAYFEVVHTPGHDRFLVHLPEGVEIEVLGTEFNVTARQKVSRVVLNSGSVRLRLPPAIDKHPLTDSLKTVLMKPGEMVQLNTASGSFTKSAVDPETYTAWKDYRFVFKETPLPEIALLLEENYGYKVVISDQSLVDRKLTGEIETNDLDVLLYALSKSFNIRVRKEKMTLFLHASD